MRATARFLATMIVGAAAVLCVTPAVWAEPIDTLVALDAPLEFTADYSVTANDQTWRGTVIHAPGRERREFGTALGTQAIVIRRDIDQAVVLWPERKWYLTTGLQALSGMVGGAEALKLDRRRDGSEMVAGENCTRWLVEGGFAGRMWFSHDGILMRAVGMLHLRGRETAISTQLAHLKREPVDADLFELPVGYHGLTVSPALLGKIN
jgi:hypothetical protein